MIKSNIFRYATFNLAAGAGANTALYTVLPQNIVVVNKFRSSVMTNGYYSYCQLMRGGVTLVVITGLSSAESDISDSFDLSFLAGDVITLGSYNQNAGATTYYVSFRATLYSNI